MKTAVEKKTKWAIDPTHSEIAFKAKYLMVSNVKGTFKQYEAIIYTDDDDFTKAKIDVRIHAESIYTGDEKRDEHLKSPDFLDIHKHKEIIFTGTSHGPQDADGRFELQGELALKGISKLIKLSADFLGLQKDPWGNEKAGFIISGAINRQDWGIYWNTVLESGGVLLSNEIKITCEIQLVKQS